MSNQFDDTIREMLSRQGYFSSYLNEFKNNTTVVFCKNLIARTVAIMPCYLMFRQADGTPTRAYQHCLFDLVANQPNIEMMPYDFKYKLVMHIMDGNAYIRVIRDTDGNPTSLFLLNPQMVSVMRDQQTMEKVYYVNGIKYDSYQIVQIMSDYNDGLRGYAISGLAEKTVQLGSQLDEYLLNNFNNQIGTNLHFDVSKLLDGIANETDRAKKVADAYKYIIAMYAGAKNTGKPLMTHSGMTVKELAGANNQQNQVAELKSLQEKDICKIYSIPAWKIDGSIKYSDTELANLIFLQECIQPWLQKIEESLDFILTPFERMGAKYYHEFDTSALLRTSSSTQVDINTKRIFNGQRTVNEVRKQDNKPPIAGGDTSFFPANALPLDQETIAAMAAGAKLKLQEAINGSSNTNSNAGNGADNKTK